MESATTTGIDELLRLTEEMFDLASEGEWDKVETYEAQRMAIIGSLAPLENDSDVAAKLKQALDKNAEIVALAMAEKNKIADELSLFRRLGKADQAYRDIDDA